MRRPTGPARGTGPLGPSFEALGFGLAFAEAAFDDVAGRWAALGTRPSTRPGFFNDACVAATVVSPTLVAAPVTIVPAMGLLWLMLHRYEEYFVFTRVMFALVAGFFAGIVVALFESQFDFAGAEAVASLGLVPSAFMFVAGYAFFEGGAKTILLGLARFRKRKDTPFYAAALGLGFGAMLAMSFLMAAWRTAGLPQVPDYEAVPFLSLVALFLGALMAHGGSTVWIGKGSADGKLAKGWLQAAALQMPILLLIRLSWPGLGKGDEAGFLGFGLLA